MRSSLATDARFVCARHVIALTPNGATLDTNQTGCVLLPTSSPERLLVAAELPIAEVRCSLVLGNAGRVPSPRVRRREQTPPKVAARRGGRGRAPRVPCGSRRTGSSSALDDFTVQGSAALGMTRAAPSNRSQCSFDITLPRSRGDESPHALMKLRSQSERHHFSCAFLGADVGPRPSHRTGLPEVTIA